VAQTGSGETSTGHAFQHLPYKFQTGQLFFFFATARRVTPSKGTFAWVSAILPLLNWTPYIFTILSYVAVHTLPPRWIRPVKWHSCPSPLLLLPRPLCVPILPPFLSRFLLWDLLHYHYIFSFS
jgi:hypothetical protein